MGLKDLNPSNYFPVHQNCIRSISWVRVPPCDSSGRSHMQEDPAIIFTTGVEGIASITDTRDALPHIVIRNRGRCNRSPKDLSAD